MSSAERSLVLDVGKTNVKLHVLNRQQESLSVHQFTNQVLKSSPYPHADVAGIWNWLLATIARISDEFDIGAIAVATHGATAALVDPDLPGDGLALPVMDYEWGGLDPAGDYRHVRPAFTETYSPDLPVGLNLGRQLFWQQKAFPDEFNRTRAILMYPQYWAWRLSGKLAGEVTSLGCHTDLWSPEKQVYSTMVESQGWQDLFPAIVPAWEVVGTIKADIAEETGLSLDCRVHAGIHDSNANLLRYLHALPGQEFCLVSSGTWVISMSVTRNAVTLDERRDMLANVDVNGSSVPCSRFMGGREYGEICKRLGAELDGEFGKDDIEQIISRQVFALPDFSGGSGPFGGREAEITGQGVNANALASLYCALMTDYCLDLLQAEGDVIIAGSFLQNPQLCSLVAQLRNQVVLLSSDTAGTVRGAGQLTDSSTDVSVSLEQAQSASIDGLVDYRVRWRELSKRMPTGTVT